MSDFFSSNLLKNDLVAAPLAGYSHMPYRRILREFFDGIIYSEMISVEGLSRRNKETMEYLDRKDYESPLVFQLFGGKPESYIEAVKVAENEVQVDAFDVNMGCPVKKVIKAGGGCALLNDLDKIKAIVQNIRKSTTKPFSIKIRIGLEQKKLVYNEILKIAENEGVDALIVHARTKSDMFSGTVRLDVLEEMAANAKIPIIGNGGVIDYDSYKKMKETGVAGVMIGRAMMKAPWVFEVIKNKQNNVYSYLSPAEIAGVLNRLWEHMLEHTNGRNMKETHYMHVLKKFAVWFCKGLDNASDFRVNIYKVNTVDEVLHIINDYYNNANLSKMVEI